MKWEEGGKQRVNTVLTAFSFYNSLVSIYLVSFSFGVYYRIKSRDILVTLTLKFLFKVWDFLKRHEVRI